MFLVSQIFFGFGEWMMMMMTSSSKVLVPAVPGCKEINFIKVYFFAGCSVIIHNCHLID